MTQYTPNYHLDLYEDSDKPNLRGQYNAAITEIDQILFGLSNGQIAINNNIATLQTKVKDNETEIAENLAAITKINGDIDGINVKLATDEANITSLQSGLETTNQNVSQTAGEVLAINGTLNVHDTRITAAQTTANEANAKATAAQQESATQGAYWQALGVSTVDEAQDLNTDIQDAHTTAMKNQGDIAVLDKDVDSLSMDFDIISSTTPTGGQVYDNTIVVFLNKAQSLFKVSGRVRATGAQYVNVSKLVPGTDGYYGVPTGIFFNKLNLESPIIYNNTGIWIEGANQYGNPPYNIALGGCVIGTDKQLYVNISGDPTALNATQYYYCNYTQPLLTTNNYSFTPTEPELPNA